MPLRSLKSPWQKHFRTTAIFTEGYMRAVSRFVKRLGNESEDELTISHLLYENYVLLCLQVQWMPFSIQ